MSSRRAYTGSVPALTPGIKIGGEFEVKPNPDFVAARIALWEELKAEKEREDEAKEKSPIKIVLPNGDVKEGVSGVTTPAEIAGSINLKNCLLARVKFDHSAAAAAAGCGARAVDSISDDEADDDDEDEEEESEGNDNENEGEGKEEEEKEEEGKAGDKSCVLWDMHRPLIADCKLWLLRYDDKDAQHAFSHSSAHLLGLSVEQCFGGKLTIGPALEKGFYYDFYVGDKLSVRPDHYKDLEAAAMKHVQADCKFERMEMTKDEALLMFADNPFKVALIAAKVKEGGMTSAYRCGPFIDLCMGPHLPSLGLIKAFAIEKHSAAYWLGNATGDSLQRVYGVAFPDAKKMKVYQTIMEEAKLRDHRNLGTKLDLFFFEPQYSPGCAFWTPAGARIYSKLVGLMRDDYKYRGFTEVRSPNLFNSELFEVSGHLANYKDCMFCLPVEGKEWALKPMNCPGHCCIFKHLNLTYKQLPIRMAEFGVLHRNEFSGSLQGLTRVRRFQQDDAHIFCRFDQVREEVSACLEFLFFIYQLFGFRFELALSTRPKKALGSVQLWREAEGQLKEALQTCGFPWKLNKGDGAFYGPKIDIEVFDALERGHQCGTIQLDFQLPLRFDLSYPTGEGNRLVAEAKAEKAKVAEDEEKLALAEQMMADHHRDNGNDAAADRREQATLSNKQCASVDNVNDLAAAAPSDAVTAEAASAAASAASAAAGSKGAAGPKKEGGKAQPKGSLEQPLKPGFARPVMVHRAILGSIERMTAVALEHFGGKLPFWLSPRQAIICPISEKYNDYAAYLRKLLVERGFDVETDCSNNTINKKIREAQLQQWNFMLVVGAQEQASQTVTVRQREDPKNQKSLTLPELLTLFEDLRDVSNRRPGPIPPFVPPATEPATEPSSPRQCADATAETEAVSPLPATALPSESGGDLGEGSPVDSKVGQTHKDLSRAEDLDVASTAVNC